MEIFNAFVNWKIGWVEIRNCILDFLSQTSWDILTQITVVFARVSRDFVLIGVGEK